MSTPEIRELTNGDFCVDFGHRWFRVRKDGTVTKKRCVFGRPIGRVHTRPATARETEMAIRHVRMRP